MPLVPLQMSSLHSWSLLRLRESREWIRNGAQPLRYVQNPPGVALGARVAYIFGGVAAVACIFCIVFLPELKGRSLEEVDELFEVRRVEEY